MKCKEVMTAFPECGLASDTAVAIATLMKEQDIGAVPICTDRISKRVIGIVTDRDLTLQVLAGGLDGALTRVQDVMTTHPVTCRSDEDLERAISAMEKHQIRRIPIVDDQDHLIGIITQADIATRYPVKSKTAEVVTRISTHKQVA